MEIFICTRAAGIYARTWYHILRAAHEFIHHNSSRGCRSSVRRNAVRSLLLLLRSFEIYGMGSILQTLALSWLLLGKLILEKLNLRLFPKQFFLIDVLIFWCDCNFFSLQVKHVLYTMFEPSRKKWCMKYSG